jgi:cellulose 1,4-beta-cellobiosidase
VGGWEDYGNAVRPANFDTDHDGLPNWWEIIKGLNVNSAAGDFSDANADLVGDGYTELDRYINWMAAPHVDCTNTVDMDLARLTRGFTNNSPVYTVSNPTNGTVSLLSGGKIAHFTGGSTNQLGSFQFTVTDVRGRSLTNTVGVRVVVSSIAPPSAPTSLSAVAGNAQVSLTWVQSTSAGITQNKVYRSTNGSSGPYNLFATLSATTSYINTGLVNGNTYYYSVTAVNTNGESSLSAYIGATPQLSAPSAPTGLTAAAGNAQVVLNWTASSGATSYRVKRATVSGGPYTSIATNTATSFTNTGLVNGTTYYYVVSAANSGGESANSSQISATPAAGSVPAAPTGLAAIAGNARVTLNWSASSGASSYRIKRATISGGPYSNIATNTTSLTYTNTGLSNGTTYYYVVSAVNTNGESANSSQVSAKPSAGTVTTLQAEAGVYGGGVTIDTNNAGFNGTGFANFPTTGGYLQFGSVNGGIGGAGTLSVRYALGITNSRTGQLVINGATNGITFTTSGAWTTWTNKPISLALGAGTTNVIRFQSNGADLGNVDEITVTAP